MMTNKNEAKEHVVRQAAELTNQQIDAIAATNLGDYEEGKWHRQFARAVLAAQQAARAAEPETMTLHEVMEAAGRPLYGIKLTREEVISELELLVELARM